MITLKEQFKNDTKTKILKLRRITGEFIANLPVEEAIAKYGDWIYSHGYSDSFTEVMVWVLE